MNKRSSEGEKCKNNALKPHKKEMTNKRVKRYSQVGTQDFPRFPIPLFQINKDYMEGDRNGCWGIFPCHQIISTAIVLFGILPFCNALTFVLEDSLATRLQVSRVLNSRVMEGYTLMHEANIQNSFTAFITDGKYFYY